MLELIARLEQTAQWKEYVKLSPKQRSDRIELISQALVETYVELDKDLLLLEESGLMVSTIFSVWGINGVNGVNGINHCIDLCYVPKKTF